MDKRIIATSTALTVIVVVATVGFSNFVLGQKIDSINTKIDNFYDNKGVTQSVEKISNSVVAVLIPVSAYGSSTQTAADYIDTNGNAWSGGAGFVIRDDGYIITAKHILIPNEPVFILLKNGTMFPVINIIIANDADVAILKVDTVLPAVQLGDFESANVGSNVIFIGYPLNEPVQITHEGIVSSKTVQNGVPSITINSIVNKGNSGGPIFLANSEKVIGIMSGRVDIAKLPSKLNDIPTNISSETQLILRNQQQIYNNLIDAIRDNSQSGIGIAVPISVNALSLLPPKQ